MHAFSYKWSCDKDGGYTIRSDLPKNPMLHSNIMALCLTEQELLLIKVLHCGNRNLRPFSLLDLDLMTFIYLLTRVR